MKYIVTDRNDKDRENPIVDSFDTREEAESYAKEMSASMGSLAVEAWENEEEAWMPQESADAQ